MAAGVAVWSQNGSGCEATPLEFQHIIGFGFGLRKGTRPPLVLWTP
jgi:hypothetical protein